MGLTHVWCCTCGAETECAAEDLRLGAVWHCVRCDKTFGCVAPKAGGKAWVEIPPEEVKFHRLIEEPEIEA